MRDLINIVSQDAVLLESGNPQHAAEWRKLLNAVKALPEGRGKEMMLQGVRSISWADAAGLVATLNNQVPGAE